MLKTTKNKREREIMVKDLPIATLHVTAEEWQEDWKGFRQSWANRNIHTPYFGLSREGLDYSRFILQDNIARIRRYRAENIS